PPSARWIPSRRRSTWSRPPRPRSCLERAFSGRLDVLTQRLLLGLVILDAPFDDVADRDQPDDAVTLEHWQVPEFAERHHFHDRCDGVVLPATYDLACHRRADRLVEHACTPLAQFAHDITLRENALDAARLHDQHGTDPALVENPNHVRKPCFRLHAHDLMTLGIENRTYRHCRLPEADRALASGRDPVP